LRWSSVKRPWIIVRPPRGPFGIVVSCPVAFAKSQPCGLVGERDAERRAVLSMTPGSLNVRIVVVWARSHDRVVAQPLRIGRQSRLLAAGRAREVVLRVEHVVHQRAHIPLVARRVVPELGGGALNLLERPLARAPIEIEHVLFHRVLPSALVTYPPPRSDNPRDA
jgi:hypothetical protein